MMCINFSLKFEISFKKFVVLNKTMNDENEDQAVLEKSIGEEDLIELKKM